jgi:ketosteroid isomerase-like protein
MTIDYAAAGDLLEAYGRAWETFDGDAWVAIFTGDAEYHEDPFGEPVVGHNALRAYLLDASASQRAVEFTTERHWVSGTTILAAWHATFTRRASGRLVRMAGFMTAEVAPDGRIARFREWTRYGPEGRG